jgi:hypothetical protein
LGGKEVVPGDLSCDGALQAAHESTRRGGVRDEVQKKPREPPIEDSLLETSVSVTAEAVLFLDGLPDQAGRQSRVPCGGHSPKAREAGTDL